MKRGDVVLVNYPFSSGIGSKVRPALIVQPDLNNGKLSNTIVAMITGTTHRTSLPTQLLIDVGTPDGHQSGLLRTSALTCENLFTIEQRLVIRRIGSLPLGLMSSVDDCLKASLGVA